jgi:hypothetical protein
MDFDNYDSCGIDYEACKRGRDISDREVMIDFDGRPQGDRWWPRKINRYNSKPMLGDHIAGDASALFMTKEAIGKLRHVMGGIELLGLDCDFGDYCAVNVLDVLDCIDYERSEFVRFSPKSEDDQPRIMRFVRYAFIADRIQGHHLFKIPDLPRSYIFADEVFIKAVEDSGVTGFEFVPLWDEEEGPIAPARKCAEAASGASAGGAPAAPESAGPAVSGLDEEDEAAVREGAQRCAGHIKAHTEDPGRVAEQIYGVIERLLATEGGDEEELLAAAEMLACLWGEAVENKYGWKWADVAYGGNEEGLICLVSPKGYYACCPFRVMYRALILEADKGDARENTSLLLFNMLDGIEDRKPQRMYQLLE